MELGEPPLLPASGAATREALVEGAAHRLNCHASQPDPRGLFQAVGRPARSARSLIPRSSRWLITKLTAATGSTSNGVHRWV